MIPKKFSGVPRNFLGLPKDAGSPEKSKVWILPIPYEATTTYGAGTRFGPDAILSASLQVELYDRRRKIEPAGELGIATLPSLAVSSKSPEEMMNRVRETIEEVFTGTPQPDLLVVLGGEHSLSAGIARALSNLWRDKPWVGVQIDAHADLRDQYEESPFSHACAGRRIVEHAPLFQIGIRNLSREEAEFLASGPPVTTVFAEDVPAGEYLAELARFVKDKYVYWTIDLDGFDPSIMPSVGTPEPGGLLWHDFLAILDTIARHAAAVPVLDVVELAPIPGLHAPDFMAAKLVYHAAAALLLGPA
ncbi:MAG: agmatinase [Thermogutta sp.]|nr:agmatinase [Thermogutta sp.]